MTFYLGFGAELVFLVVWPTERMPLRLRQTEDRSRHNVLCVSCTAPRVKGTRRRGRCRD